MKTAVGVIFTAALGTALPHVETSTTTFSSRSTDAAIESKIPWVEYKGDPRACTDAVRNKATRQKLEEACGTENFCDLWDPEDGPDNLKDKSERYGYANKTECLAAHAKIPWVEYKGDYGACTGAIRNKATRQKLEEACGTENFCDLWDPEDGPDNLKDKSERYGYANKTECLAAHEPAHTKPQSKIPWVEYKGDPRACTDAVRNKATRQKLEEACGTENFCDLWDPEDGPDNLKDKSERYGYANKTECLAAHEPKP